MKPSKEVINELKDILDDLGSPDRLDNHRWARSLTVDQFVAEDPTLQRMGRGYQLLAVLSKLFREMMPSVPPRRGKRLDTQWGQFGLLAALYFAPFEYATVRPTSLLDAWGRIDQAIPLFVYGKPDRDLPESELGRYRLLAGEEAAPNSTLSDWHTKGLERLAELFLSREQHLSGQVARPSALPVPAVASQPTARVLAAGSRLVSAARGRERRLWAALVLLLLAWVGWKGWRVYALTRSVHDELAQFDSLVKYPPDPALLQGAGSLLRDTRRDVAALTAEVKPFLWLGPLLGWAPLYGPDLAAAQPLLDLANGLADAADEAYQGAWPLWQVAESQAGRSALPQLIELAAKEQPHFAAAASSLDRALAARSAIDAGQLSPRNRRLIADRIDHYLPLLQDGVAMGMALPRLLGASSFGPQTYLILIQNEDELRATGGFISAAGIVTVSGGEIFSVKVDDSYAVDDLDKPYPFAPDPLRLYMDAGRWLFRDANWSPDFPTSALKAQTFYSYAHPGPIDGVVAIDVTAVRYLLEAIGPLTVEGATAELGANNVVDYMRSAWSAAPAEGASAEWLRQHKQFIGNLAVALLAKTQSNSSLSWPAVSQAATRALDERHVLIQLADPEARAAISRHGWDGAIAPGAGDYLMVVDSNIGFNKVNAVVQTRLDYRVDLSDLAAPRGTLIVTHRNPPSDKPVACHHAADDGTGQYAELIARCYWNYLRVYGPDGARLLEATPHGVPAANMLLDQAVPPQVDPLENINGAVGYGTLLLVAVGETVETRFGFALPAGVLAAADGATIYRLRIQKQPGTQANPVNLHIRLPDGAQFVRATPAGAVINGWWEATVDLQTDQDISLTFQTR